MYSDDFKVGVIFGIGIVLASYLIVVSNSAFGADGKKAFNKCKSCHSLTINKHGPSLGNIFNNKVGSGKYKYSKAMKKSNIIWTEKTLDEFLANPKTYIKGTKMKIRGLKKTKREVVIKYLKENQVK